MRLMVTDRFMQGT